jgi:hypothetical protein
MASTSTFDAAFKQAVAPGTERLLTSVALAAAARGTGGMADQYHFRVLKRCDV